MHIVSRRIPVLGGLSAGLGSFARTIYPPCCSVCRQETVTGRGLCADCWDDLAFLDGAGCLTCARPLPGRPEDPLDRVCDHCLTRPPRWRRGQALFRYDGAGRRMILSLKHGDRLDTVPLFADWAVAQAPGLVGAADVVVPVPLHWTRRLKRRANQAAEIGRAIAARTGARHLPRALLRVRRTGTQDGKNAEARRDNVTGAIAPGPGARSLVGRHVLLVDDVMTTGATLNACTDVLHAAGASTVDVLVLALVVRDETGYIPHGAEEMSDETG